MIFQSVQLQHDVYGASSYLEQLNILLLILPKYPPIPIIGGTLKHSKSSSSFFRSPTLVENLTTTVQVGLVDYNTWLFAKCVWYVVLNKTWSMEYKRMEHTQYVVQTLDSIPWGTLVMELCSIFREFICDRWSGWDTGNVSKLFRDSWTEHSLVKHPYKSCGRATIALFSKLNSSRCTQRTISAGSSLSLLYL